MRMRMIALGWLLAVLLNPGLSGRVLVKDDRAK